MMGCNSLTEYIICPTTKNCTVFYSNRTEAPKKSASIVEKLLEGEEAPPVNVKLFLKYFFNKHQTLLCFSLSLTFSKGKYFLNLLDFGR